MNFLSANQLAFLLNLKVEEAKDKIIVAHCKEKGLKIPYAKDLEKYSDPKRKNKVIDPRKDYPNVLSIELLAKHHNLPTLQQMVDDTHENYLKRPATKKWILCDFPEKQIAKWAESGEKKKLGIPPGLKSMLKAEDIITIHDEWKKRYPGYNGEMQLINLEQEEI